MLKKRKRELDYQVLNEQSMSNFYSAISEIKTDDHTWLEAIIEYCELTGCDVEEIIAVIPDSVKSHLYTEAIAHRMIKDPGPILDFL